MFMTRNRKDTALHKELLIVEKQEKKMEQAALKAKPPLWKEELERRIPEKIYWGLESAFCKGFEIVFDKGRAIIEKSFQKDEIQKDHAIRDYAATIKGGRKELKHIHKHAKQSSYVNMAATTVEGIGLGALGVGMPDIVLFLGTVLKGVYETALNYGFEYDTEQEKLLILKMMQTALSTGEDWTAGNNQVEEMIRFETVDITQDMIHQQIKKTASAFAMDMLLLKFIQGVPVVGIIGGAANPVYYSKVMKYVQVKYRKRYLLNKKTQSANQ